MKNPHGSRPRRRSPLSPDVRLASPPLVFLAALALSSCRGTGVFEVAEYSRASACLPDSISIVSWNAQKGHDPRVADDLSGLLREKNPDLVFLQESRVDLFDPREIGGHFAPSWHYPWPGGSAVGLTTLSRVSPASTVPLPSRWREFFITAPKLSLATEYRLDGGGTLLAVNVHCLVFERWGTMRFRSQLRDLEALIARHDGPVILAGDFNTWSHKRLALVHDFAQRLGLSEVEVWGERTTGSFRSAFGNWFFGVDEEASLDRVFQRGFDVRSATTLPYHSSDHIAIHAVLERRAAVVQLAEEPKAALAEITAGDA